MRLILLCLINFNFLIAQHWVDRNFNYDSIYDIRYGSAINFAGGMDELHMDVFTPKCGADNKVLNRPFILFIHGGAFLAGTKYDQNIVYMCKQFARRGYVTASLEYRLGFIADDTAHNCVYPNYNCVFASDKAEWIRAYYRGIQDAKGAIRYFVKNAREYGINPHQIFLVGESAGGFVALGAAFMDDNLERPIETNALHELNRPADNAIACTYNLGKLTTAAKIQRPDLLDISGTIETSYTDYTILAVGNMYGGMISDLLKIQHGTKPGIYLFHQPCDIVVPIDSNQIYNGLSWCMTNGYGCYGISNTPVVYGSRGIKNWITKNNYPYVFQAEFTTIEFPYSFLLGDGSCADQVNKPCHAYDNLSLRETQLATFFAKYLTNSQPCQELVSTNSIGKNPQVNIIYDHINRNLLLVNNTPNDSNCFLINAMGVEIQRIKIKANSNILVDLYNFPQAVYYLVSNDLIKKILVL